MTMPCHHWTIVRAILIVGIFASVTRLEAQSNSPTSQVEDGWTRDRDEQSGVTVMTKVLTLHPKTAPEPALKYRLLSDDFELLTGNAAVYYLKAMGYLEQDPARKRTYQFRDEAAAKAAELEKGIQEVPPHVWLTTAPEELPLGEVHEYLNLSRFQIQHIQEASRRRHFNMDRNLREVDDPVGIWIPEIQPMRELARTQSIRCRLAIAEDRVEDAIEILGQQFAMARHLGQDDFLISNLVGIAIAGVAWNDMLYLVQHAGTPNLYWALTAMPQPLVDRRHSMAFERHFLYQQLKVLQEVGESARPAGYWSDFIDRFVGQLGSLSSELDSFQFGDDPATARAGMVGFVAAAYPGAKSYLIDRWGISPEQVESYATAQVVFLAMVRFHDYWRDEVFKWSHLPVWQARSRSESAELERAMRAEMERYGWFTVLTQAMLPAVEAARVAEARCDQTIALLRTVEAVRMYAAEHDGQLPPSLEDLSVPAPIEPFTGKPVAYERLGDRAIISGHPLPGLQYRLVLQIAH